MSHRLHMTLNGRRGNRPFWVELLESRLPFAADYTAGMTDLSGFSQYPDNSQDLVELMNAGAPNFSLPNAEDIALLGETNVDDYFGEIGSAIQPQGDAVIAWAPSTIPIAPTEYSGENYLLSNDWFDTVPSIFENDMLLRSSPIEASVADEYFAEISSEDVVPDSTPTVDAITPVGNVVWIGATHQPGSIIAAIAVHLREPSLLGTSIPSTELLRGGPSLQFPSVNYGAFPPGLVNVIGNLAIDIDSLVLGLSLTHVAGNAASSNSTILQLLPVKELFRFQIESLTFGDEPGRFNYSLLALNQADDSSHSLTKVDSDFAADARFQSLNEITPHLPLEIDLHGQLPVHRSESYAPRSCRHNAPSERSIIMHSAPESLMAISSLAISKLPQGMLAIGGEIGSQANQNNRIQNPRLHFVMQATLICEDLNSKSMWFDGKSEEVAGSDGPESVASTSTSSMGIVVAGCIVIGVQFRFQSIQTLVNQSKNGTRFQFRKLRNRTNKIALPSISADNFHPQ